MKDGSYCIDRVISLKEALRPLTLFSHVCFCFSSQVQVIFLYLQCQNLPEALLTKHLDIDDLET